MDAMHRPPIWQLIVVELDFGIFAIRLNFLDIAVMLYLPNGLGDRVFQRRGST